MPEPIETRESLLIRLGDSSSNDAWHEFSSIYRPMILRLARRCGLQSEDAEDVTQQVMVSVMKVIGNWRKDAKRGRFRGWLTAVTKNAVRNAITRVPRDRASGDTQLQQMLELSAVAPEIDEIIEAEFMRSVFREAAFRVQAEYEPKTWQAFWRTAVDGIEIADAANQLSLTTGAVYSARSRVMRRLQVVASEITQEDSNDG